MDREESVGRWLGMLHRYARRRFSEGAARYGIAEGQFPILMSLLHADGVSQDELAQHHLLDKATIARSVARLEKLGYVERRPDEQDRRIKRVLVTAKARAVEPELLRMREEWSEVLAEGFSERQRADLLALLGRMVDNARRFVEEERD